MSRVGAASALHDTPLADLLKSHSLLESGSQKVQHLFGGFKVKTNIISITNQVPAENSADLERADSARSIAA